MGEDTVIVRGNTVTSQRLRCTRCSVRRFSLRCAVPDRHVTHAGVREAESPVGSHSQSGACDSGYDAQLGEGEGRHSPRRRVAREPASLSSRESHAFLGEVRVLVRERGTYASRSAYPAIRSF